MLIYLLHFEKKLGHSQHYLGFSESHENFHKRLERHTKGQGSRLMRAVSKAGINFAVARIWEGKDRNFERKLKNRKNAPKLCPICKGKLHFEEWLR